MGSYEDEAGDLETPISQTHKGLPL